MADITRSVYSKLYLRSGVWLTLPGQYTVNYVPGQGEADLTRLVWSDPTGLRPVRRPTSPGQYTVFHEPEILGRANLTMSVNSKANLIHMPEVQGKADLTRLVYSDPQA